MIHSELVIQLEYSRNGGRDKLDCNVVIFYVLNENSHVLSSFSDNNALLNANYLKSIFLPVYCTETLSSSDWSLCVWWKPLPCKQHREH